MAKKSSMTLETVDINDLQAHPRNYRGHPEEQIAHLKASLAEYGIVKNIVVASDNVILAGHGLVQAARELGYTELPVCRIAMPSTDPKAQKFMVLDNEVSRKSEDDTGQLAALLKELQDSQDLTGTGYDSDEVTQLLNDLQAEEFGATLNEDAGPEEPPIEPVTRLGDIWVMGEHRLVCGDSTDINNWPEKGVTITDPPYGIGFNYIGHEDNKETNAELVSDVFLCCPDGIVWTPGLMNLARELSRYPEAKILVWYKGFAQAGNGLGGASTWEPVIVNNPPVKKLKNDFLHFGTDRVELDNVPLNKLHPCPKPVSLYEELILSFSDKQVIDPFMGSGTTLIAAEQTGRICYGIELEPRYVDVAVKRWQKLTGKQAILESTGEAFSGE